MNPQALVSSVYKARYYQNCSFLEAKLRDNPSYIWRSILSTQSLLKLGMCWRIGDGRYVKIWSDHWFWKDNSPYITIAPYEGLEDLTVSHLLNPNG